MTMQGLLIATALDAYPDANRTIGSGPGGQGWAFRW